MRSKLFQRLPTKKRIAFEAFFRTLPLLFLTGLICLTRDYCLYIPIWGYYMNALQSFFFCVGLCFLMHWFLSRNRVLRETRIGILAGTAFIVELFGFLLFIQYHPWIALFIYLLTIPLMIRIANAVTRQNKVDPADRQRIRRCKEHGKALATIAFCIILIVPSCLGVHEEYSGLSDANWEAFTQWYSKTYEDKPDSDNGEDPALQKIRTDLANWDSLSMKKRETTVRMIAQTEKEYLGLSKDTDVAVFFEKMSPTTMGYYRDEEKKIYIGYIHLHDDDAEDVVDTILHEMHHAFVYQTIAELDFDSEFVQQNHYYAKAREWKQNSDAYISAHADPEGYFSQPIERDARIYAISRTPFYLGTTETAEGV